MNDTDNDKNLWLEEVEGERALDWVRQQNTRSLATIQAHPAYAGNLETTQALATSTDRIPYGSLRDGFVYNFWQDEKNVRGIWRRTPLESYRLDSPDWELVLDFDELAENEGKNWVFKGVSCLTEIGKPVRHCLVSLSDGGKDSVTAREFDLDKKAFVVDGFEIPESRLSFAWIDSNQLLLATDWNADGSTLTTSGYPSSVRLWQRGDDLNKAVELYKGGLDDVGTFPWSERLDDGRRIYGALEADTFFTQQTWILSHGDPLQIPVPPKVSLQDIFQNRQFLSLQQDWQIPGTQSNFKSGDLLAFELDTFIDTRKLPAVELVFRPNGQQAVNGVQAAKGELLLSINDNVASQVLRINRAADGWQTESLDLPMRGRAGISYADRSSSKVLLNYEGFLTPDSLLIYDTQDQSLQSLKALPTKFSADGLVVHQKHAISNDGTRIPYFVVHRDNIVLNSETPTLIYAYGGFEISQLPSYSGNIGKLWLEKGGAYVLANIRGGGEFGPAWHQAGLKTNRQTVYDDFIAVAEDLIRLKITRPRRIGIMGGSNGGLLMGVMLTQRPDLWNAAVVQVPLLDMLRYHKLLAGASWVDEYGDPEIPEEREFLEKTSPYHNFDAAADYPTPLFVTSTKDDRVHPAHARKMARLFELADKPFLYYENTDGGHSAAANQQERAKRIALEFTYLSERLMDAQ